MRLVGTAGLLVETACGESGDSMDDIDYVETDNTIGSPSFVRALPTLDLAVGRRRCSGGRVWYACLTSTTTRTVAMVSGRCKWGFQSLTAAETLKET